MKSTRHWHLVACFMSQWPYTLRVILCIGLFFRFSPHTWPNNRKNIEILILASLTHNAYKPKKILLFCSHFWQSAFVYLLCVVFIEWKLHSSDWAFRRKDLVRLHNVKPRKMCNSWINISFISFMQIFDPMHLAQHKPQRKNNKR